MNTDGIEAELKRIEDNIERIELGIRLLREAIDEDARDNL